MTRRELPEEISEAISDEMLDEMLDEITEKDDYYTVFDNADVVQTKDGKWFIKVNGGFF
jgi:putative heme iron utilization protein